MTRVAFISDLHLEFREHGIGGVPAGHFHIYGSVSFPATLVADILVLAGDIHPYAWVRESVTKRIEDHYGIPVILAPGNHDYWGSPWPHDVTGDIMTVNGTRFAWATMWTHIPTWDFGLTTNFSDFRYISGLTIDAWNDRNHAHIDFLRKAKADVVVTHHAPSYRSVHPRFQGDAHNVFFANEIDFENFEDTKVWIHGHMHDEFDYFAHQTQVMCNPLGYPHERKTNVAIKMIEV